MHGRWNTDKSKHSKVIEFGTKANADRYVAAGWEIIETRAEPFILGKLLSSIESDGQTALVGLLCHLLTTYAICKKDLQQTKVGIFIVSW